MSNLVKLVKQRVNEAPYKDLQTDPRTEPEELCCNYDDNYYGDQYCAPCDSKQESDSQAE